MIIKSIKDPYLNWYIKLLVPIDYWKFIKINSLSQTAHFSKIEY